MARSWYLLITLVFMLYSCQSTTSAPTEFPTTTLDQKGTDAVKTAKQATEAWEATSIFQATLDVKATSIAQLTSNAVATKTQKSVDYLSTLTQIASTKSAATAESKLQATEQVQHFTDSLQKIAELGEMTLGTGELHQLKDFEKEIAKINYFNYWSTGYSGENFALETDIDYDVASDKANWFNTGCGFVFAEQGQDVFHFLKLSLDGMATLRSFNGNNRNVIMQRNYGKPALPSGQMHVFMVVQDKHVFLVINDEPIIDTNCPLIKAGDISLSLSSGINTGFGTRCKFSNTGLWIFE